MKTTIKAVLLASTLAFGLSASPIYMSTQPGSAPCSPLTTCQIGTITAAGTVSGLVNTNIGGSALPADALELYDVAVNAMDEVYGVDSSGRLWTVNPANGHATLVASVLAGGVPSTRNGLAFGADGLLYLSGSSGTIYRANLATDCAAGTCTFNAANSSPLPSNSAGDIAYFNNRLYLAAEDDKLYELVQVGNNWVLNNQSSAALTVPEYSGFNFKGLAAADGTLYAVVHGFLQLGGEGQSIHAINIANLTLGPTNPATPFGPLPGFAAGLGSNNNFSAVPEPSVYMLSAIGLGMIAFSRRKKKTS